MTDDISDDVPYTVIYCSTVYDRLFSDSSSVIDLLIDCAIMIDAP